MTTVFGRAWLPRNVMALTAMLALTGGCGTPAPPVADSFYRLDIAGPSAGGIAAAPRSRPLLPGVVEVPPLRADGLVADRALIYGDGSGVLRKYNYHLWEKAPPRLLQDDLVSYLRTRGIAEQVVTSEVRLRADYVIQGRLDRLEQILTPGGPARGVVEMELGLIRDRDQTAMVLRTYRAERPAADESVAALVTALRGAAEDVFARFATDMEAAAAAVSPPPSGGRGRN